MDGRWQWLSNNVGLLVLRLGAGGFMVVHGYGKFLKVLEGDFSKMSDPIGIGPTASLILIMLAEFFGALLVMCGLLTRFAAATLVFGMGVAAFVAHAADPWTAGEGARLFMTGAAKGWGSKEPALLFGVVFLALMITGPGKLSFDYLIWPSAVRWWNLRKTKAQAAE